MGVQVAPGRHFLATGKPTAASLATELGQQVVLKPNRQGSSVGLQIVSSKPGLEIALGGFVYSVGAVIYALKRPDPSPRYFGYHEIFHACTIVAAVCHFVAIALVTLR